MHSYDVIACITVYGSRCTVRKVAPDGRALLSVAAVRAIPLGGGHRIIIFLL